MSKYHLKTLILKSGERLPMLLSQTGTPIHGPMVFVVAELRNRHRAANTMANTLSALSVFHQFLDEQNIDLAGRLADGRLLELGEIEALVRTCRIDFSGRNGNAPTVTAAVCATRLRTVRTYLEWLVRERLLAKDYAHISQLQRLSDLTLNTINARIPPKSPPLEPREGLAAEAIRKIFDVVDDTSAQNPWRSEHVRVRNKLIWNILYYLGVRRGELLGIRVRNIDFRRGTLSIVRQADSPDDPRPRQPNAKTLARELAISEALQKQLSDYILNHRRNLKNAHRHDFLLVSERGDPLSCPALNKLFNVLRETHPELPRGLTPHAVRHTWNDMFSTEMEERNVDPENEKKIRSYQMGWRPTSNSASVYTRRFVRKKAQEISLRLQKKVMNGMDK